MRNCREFSQPLEYIYLCRDKNVLVMALIKRQILSSREVLHALNQLLFGKKDAFQNTPDFCRLKCHLK